MLRTDRHWCGAGSRGVLNKLVVLIAATALSAIVAAHGETTAASRVSANSSKFAGAFVNWGAVGRERYVAGLGKMAEAGAFVGAGR